MNEVVEEVLPLGNTNPEWDATKFIHELGCTRNTHPEFFDLRCLHCKLLAVNCTCPPGEKADWVCNLPEPSTGDYRANHWFYLLWTALNYPVLDRSSSGEAWRARGSSRWRTTPVHALYAAWVGRKMIEKIKKEI